MKEQYKKYRLHDIQKKLRIMSVYPLDVLVVGATGVGKSSTLNAFFQKGTAKVGFGVNPETEAISSYNLNSLCRLWDTPGLGDSIEKDKAYMQMLQDILCQGYGDHGQYGLIDLVLVVMEGGSKDLSIPIKLLRDVIFPNIQEDRVLLAINQADHSMHGRHWNYEQGQPDDKLKVYLEEQIHAIHVRLKKDTGKDNIPLPVYYSSLYDYRIYELYDLLIDNVPVRRRRLQQ